MVSAEGVPTDPAKLQSFLEFPIPTNIKQLRLFLGLTSYYRRFISQSDKIPGPLHAQKISEFMWSAVCQGALEKLRTLLTSALVLAYPDFGVPFILKTDASGNGL